MSININGCMNININGSNIQITGGENTGTIICNNGKVLINGKPFEEKTAKTFDRIETFSYPLKNIEINAKTTYVIINKGKENKIQYTGGYFGDKEPTINTNMAYEGIIINIDNDDIITQNCNFLITLKDECEKLIVKNMSGNIIANDMELDFTELSTMSGDIHFDGYSRCIKADSTSGDINLFGNFKTTSAKNISGDIEIDITGIDDSGIGATTVSGDIDITAKNFGNYKTRLETTTGKTKNNIKNQSGKYTLTGLFQSVSGDIAIR